MLLEKALMHGLKTPRRATNPVGERRAIERDPLSGVNPPLAMDCRAKSLILMSPTRAFLAQRPAKSRTCRGLPVRLRT